MTPRAKKTTDESAATNGTATKVYTRRTPEEMIADLEAKIAGIKTRQAARAVKQSDDGKALLVAVKGLDKAATVATEAGNKAMVQALERARAPLSELLVEMGVRVPAKGRRRELKAV